MYTEKKVLSTDGIHELAGKVYYPDTEPVGIFHMVHGMTEYMDRYDAFMEKMADAGFVACGYDHVGHGYTARNDDELGFIAHKDGWHILTDDVIKFADDVRAECKEKYGKDLPYTLCGHSMGSFIVRLAADKKRPDKLVIMGTGGPNPATGLGMAVIRNDIKRNGEMNRSESIKKLAFGSYNNKFKDENDPVSWLTKDKAIREKYAKDKYCTFLFTSSAMLDLMNLTRTCNLKKWSDSIAAPGPDGKRLPILIVSGAEDPVGNYGKGVKKVYNKIKKAGGDVELKLYENCRHEILNDTCKEELTEKLIDFSAKIG